jgi:hypothetical protein
MLTKQPRVVVTPGTPAIRGRPSYTVCAPPTPTNPGGGGIGGGDGGGTGERVCTLVCRPRSDLGMGSPITVCEEYCYWKS